MSKSDIDYQYQYSTDQKQTSHKQKSIGWKKLDEEDDYQIKRSNKNNRCKLFFIRREIMKPMQNKTNKCLDSLVLIQSLNQ